jgi:hypothetical protein
MAWYGIVWYELELAIEMEMVWYALVCQCIPYNTIPYHTIANALVWYAFHFHCMVYTHNGMVRYGMECVGIRNVNGNGMVHIGMVCISLYGMVCIVNRMHWKWK